MTHSEKIALATARELEILRESVNRFDQAIADSHLAASDARQALIRLESIQEDEKKLDEKIAELDELTGRGSYAEAFDAAFPEFPSIRPSLKTAADNIQGFGDLARDIARNSKPAAEMTMTELVEANGGPSDNVFPLK
jgi:predicted translin family RNA/ssDNA-binding protein